VLDKRYDTRGHRYKLVPQLCKYDLRKHFFVNKLGKIWNSLPDDVVSACSVNSFKRRFDSIGRGFSLYYDLNPTSSTGSRCENSISLVLLIFVQMLSTSDGNRGLLACFRIFIDDDDDVCNAFIVAKRYLVGGQRRCS